jgi:ABC-type transport system involved in cytochrome c biogenesis permease subunit
LRVAEAQRLPLHSRYDLLLWFVWWVVLVYLVVEERTRVTLPGLLVAGASYGLGCGCLLRMDSSLFPVLPQQNSVWFALHAAVLYASYAPLAIAVAIEWSSLFYGPLTRRELRESVERQERYLEFRNYAYRLILFAFPLLSLAIISNALWRSSVRGHYWAWGGEETWALIAWLLFACYLHLRTQVRTSRTLVMAVSAVGLLAITLTFTGVNWLVKLLHLRTG